ncbi:AI-2E family transporter [Candidatus Woesearchaeota archaeon]|nr:MAG: AI-2E family transporter [Candidatus Woesearchaeota archaeon]
MTKPYLSYIIISLIAVYLIYPLHEKLLRKLKLKMVSAIVMTLFVLLIFILPLIILGNLIVNDAVTLYQSLDIKTISETINNLLGEEFQNLINPFLSNILDYIAKNLSTFLLSLPSKLMGLIISIGIIYFAFKEGDILVTRIRSVLPLKKEDKDKVILKFKQTMDGIVFGTIIMALVEGLVAGIIFKLFGIPAPVIWGLVTAIISMLPFIGPAFVWAPASLYVYLSGRIYAAVALFILSWLIITLFLDIFLKNKMIAKKGKIHPILVLLGVIGGVSVFGIVGFIIGPFLLSLLSFLITIVFNENGIKNKKN